MKVSLPLSCDGKKKRKKHASRGGSKGEGVRGFRLTGGEGGAPPKITEKKGARGGKKPKSFFGFYHPPKESRA